MRILFPDFVDISSLVSKFQGEAGAPIKARAQLQPNLVNPANSVSFADIGHAVSSFQGVPYPFAGPSECP